jgi:plastocyanin domain-containing protein
MKFFIIGIIFISLLAGTTIYFMFLNDKPATTSVVSNVYIEKGTQIVEIRVKGGYFPQVTNASSGLPTVLRFITNSTFDCSSALNIPSLNFQTNLPLSGTTDVPIPVPAQNTKLQGLCSMGMYNFIVNFN